MVSRRNLLKPGSPSKMTMSQRGAINWLCDDVMLPKVLPQARIWVYNYNSNCYFDNAPEVDILGLGESFLERLWLAKSEDVGNRLIAFVGSCFGGIVVAQVRLTNLLMLTYI